MTIYISDKVFFTKGIDNDLEITSGVIPGLQFIIKKMDGNLVYLENIDTKALVIVTEDMLNSTLFIKKE